MTLEKTVRLRNGSEEMGAVVQLTLMALDALWTSERLGDVLDVADLVASCVNGDKMRDKTIENLKDSGLLDSEGNVHNSVKNVVLSSFEGEGLDLHMVNPVRPND